MWCGAARLPSCPATTSTGDARSGRTASLWAAAAAYHRAAGRFLRPGPSEAAQAVPEEAGPGLGFTFAEAGHQGARDAASASFASLESPLVEFARSAHSFETANPFFGRGRGVLDGGVGCAPNGLEARRETLNPAYSLAREGGGSVPVSRHGSLGSAALGYFQQGGSMQGDGADGGHVPVPVAHPLAPGEVPQTQLMGHDVQPQVSSASASADAPEIPELSQMPASPIKVVARSGFGLEDLADAVPDIEVGQELMADDEPLPASRELAKAKAERMLPRRPDGTPYPVAQTDTMTIGAVFGTGVAVYTNALKTFAKVFCIMTLLSVYAMYVNFQTGIDAGGLEAFNSGLSLFTVGALQLGADQEIAGMEAKAVLLAIVVLDMVAVLVFLCYAAYLGGQNDIIDAEADRQAVTLDDYTVEVYGLPNAGPDTSVEKIRRHFMQFGPVVDVVNATDLGASMSKRKKLAKTMRAYDEHTARGNLEKANSARTEIDSLAADIKETEREAGGVVATFVTFESEEAALRAREALPLERLSCLKSSDLRYGDARVQLSVKRAPAPSELLWENMRCGKVERFFRSLLGIIVMLLVVGCTIAAAGAAKDQLTRMPEQIVCAHTERRYATNNPGLSVNLVCEDIWPLYNTTGDVRFQARAKLAPFLGPGRPPASVCNEFTSNFRFQTNVMGMADGMVGSGNEVLLGDANGTLPDGSWAGGYDPATQADECAAQVCYSCYCAGMGLLEYQKDNDFYDLEPYCDDYWWNQLLFAGLLAGVLVVMAASNVILRQVAIALGSFECWHTVTERDSAIANRLWIALLLNTAVVPVMTYAYIAELKDVPFFFEGEIRDFNVSWYDAVAAAIVTSAMINAFVFPLFHFFEAQFYYLRTKCCMWRARTQAEMDELALAPPFLLSDRYGEALAMFFYCLPFSSGLPILYPVMAWQMLLSFMVDKITLLTLVRTPPRYSRELGNTFQLLMPWAVVGHLGVAVWLYGHQALPSFSVRDDVNVVIDDTLNQGALDYDDQFDVGARLGRLNALVPFCFLALLVAVLVLLYVARTFGSALTTVCQCLGLCMSAAVLQGIPPLSEAIRTGELLGLPSYRAEANEEYAELFQSAKKAKKRPSSSGNKVVPAS